MNTRKGASTRKSGEVILNGKFNELNPFPVVPEIIRLCGLPELPWEEPPAPPRRGRRAKA
jgi:hypothetical protein